MASMASSEFNARGPSIADDSHIISSFDGDNEFLSNFYASSMTVSRKLLLELAAPGVFERRFSHDKEFATVEHAFQALKATNHADYERVRIAPTPGIAKRLGRNVERRHDWDHVKIKVMRKLLRVKFDGCQGLKRKLMATNYTTLIEGNTWNDRFWGQCPIGTGHNVLGHLLMQLRSEYYLGAAQLSL